MDSSDLTTHSPAQQALVNQACDIAAQMIELMPEKTNGALAAFIVATFTASIVDGVFETGNRTLKQRRDAVDVIANLAKQFLALPAPANTAVNA